MGHSQHLQHAITLHQQGQLVLAEKAYLQILKTEPQHTDANHLLGMLNYQQGQYDIALERLTQLVSQTPRPIFLNTLGLTYAAANNETQAEISYQRAIQLDTQYTEAHYNLGLLYQSTAKPKKATEYYQKVLTLDPKHIKAMVNLAVIYLGANQADDALKLLNEALKLNPNHTEAWINLSQAEHKTGNVADAIVAIEKAINLNPNSAEAWTNLSVLQQAQGQLCEAKAAAQKALNLSPNFLPAKIQLASTLAALDDNTAACQLFTEITNQAPNGAKNWHNLGLTYSDLGEIEQAYQCYQSALSIDENYAEAWWDLSLLQLKKKQFHPGWQNYQWYWQRHPTPIERQDFNIPFWQGEPLAGKHMLIWGEQGIGDEVMFASLLPTLLALKAKITLLCEPRLVAVFNRSFPAIDCVANNVEIDGRHFDYQANYSLAASFTRQTLDDFPKINAYLTADKGLSDLYTKELTLRHPDKIHIGFSWRSGNRRNGSDRSLDLSHWQGLFNLPWVNWVNLQYGETEQELNDASEQFGVNITPCPVDPLTDMDGFFSVINALDGIVSIDNTTVHVAGSLGVPTWVLLSQPADWRWGLSETKSEWYSSISLLRVGHQQNFEQLTEQAKVAIEQHFYF